MFPRLRSFMTTLLYRKRFEASLDEEVRFHLDAQTHDLLRAGVPPLEAARRARVQFGSIEAMKEGCRQERGVRTIDLGGPRWTLKSGHWWTVENRPFPIAARDVDAGRELRVPARHEQRLG